jgi:radical SAM superfamily enzyme YgiQ (UPF0313 family)
MKKIALIRPFFDSLHVSPQLGLGYLSSYLKQHGYSVLLIDALRDRLSLDAVLERIQSESIEVIGITCMTPYYHEAVTMSLYFKDKGYTVVFGGVHPTFMPYQTLVDSKADYVFCGEGEIALLKLLENNMDNQGIKGVYSLKNLNDADSPYERADIIHNLDGLPFPDWDSMAPNDFPPAPMGVFFKKYPIATIMTTRGCPYKCTFCASTNFYEGKIRFRSPENVVDEMLYLQEKFNVKEFHFIDDSINMNKAHLENICKLIIEKKLKVCWSCPNGIRADKIDENLLGLMKKAGCYYIAIGIESSNPEILRNIKKAETIEAITDAIEIINRCGIGCGAAFLFGLPGETKETIKNTIDFMLRVNLERAHIFMLSLLPGCELFNNLKGQYSPDFSKKIFKDVQWAPEGLTKNDLSKAISTAYRKFYLRPNILFKLLVCIKPRQLKYICKRAFEFGMIFRRKY